MKELIEIVKKDEGFSQYAYKCPAGKWTIGHGQNIDPDKSGPGLTRSAAHNMLVDQLTETTKMLQREFPHLIELSPVRRDVLIMMAFQIGVKGLMKFSKTLKYIHQREWDKVAAEMLDSKWAEQTPARAMRLSKMMLKGEY